jgi:hypothetical protein
LPTGTEEELDDIQVEVALEQTATVTEKDGSHLKTYKGLEDGVSKVMGEMKKDILGRTVRPWKVSETAGQRGCCLWRSFPIG